MNNPAEESSRPVPIVDLVFGRGDARKGTEHRRGLIAGTLIAVALYTCALITVSQIGRTAGPWAADLAARVHDVIAAERAVDVTPTPPPPPPPATEAPPAPAAHVVARSPRAAHARPAAPAQAGKLAAVSSEPADFTGSAFVVGSGPSYAGGTTTSTGTSRTPAHGAVAPGGTGSGAPSAPSRARAVSLDQAAWSCPWPAEADAQQVNEQTVVLRAAVRADGRAEQVDIVSDPGFGFGAAARACALQTRFEPARDPAGQPTAALSPPIRVHFFR
jgi:protein TonB